MNIIAEGFEGGSDTDFQRFLIIVKESCGEVKSMLYIAKVLKLIVMSFIFYAKVL